MADQLQVTAETFDQQRSAGITAALTSPRDGIFRGQSAFINLGSENGFSVNEVVETARRITSRPLEVKIAPRRAGDPSKLVADAAKARSVLGWKPQFPELENIIESAWAWHQANPAGYDDKIVQISV